MEVGTKTKGIYPYLRSCSNQSNFSYFPYFLQGLFRNHGLQGMLGELAQIRFQKWFLLWTSALAWSKMLTKLSFNLDFYLLVSLSIPSVFGWANCRLLLWWYTFKVLSSVLDRLLKSLRKFWPFFNLKSLFSCSGFREVKLRFEPPSLWAQLELRD